MKKLNASRHERQSIRTTQAADPSRAAYAPPLGAWEWALKEREAHGTRCVRPNDRWRLFVASAIRQRSWSDGARLRRFGRTWGVDVLALKAGEPILVIQATSGHTYAASFGCSPTRPRVARSRPGARSSPSMATAGPVGTDSVRCLAWSPLCTATMLTLQTTHAIPGSASFLDMTGPKVSNSRLVTIPDTALSRTGNFP